ncbi:uncharacterized protein LACBIDRAFT_295721 [Laccaria bicolor S238N-H82]|uniref:Predicted protein n=1 Tax=Laccaria bicolor (strain S238N-H82 / ATCC MYA-4686) TaxID=486041 RepID=B0DXJ5_LACBS|nr:uncharacterized protein LACBIDRAFT_295721 [Laccaria bicolor S238N-H82]EDR00689.1 predicted protein [Laccaria bicolor S238N-H82]|eukprot:XP_001888698.1 predicted protein [Laccaria bicolor S238N-H82]
MGGAFEILSSRSVSTVENVWTSPQSSTVLDEQGQKENVEFLEPESYGTPQSLFVDFFFHLHRNIDQLTRKKHPDDIELVQNCTVRIVRRKGKSAPYRQVLKANAAYITYVSPRPHPAVHVYYAIQPNPSIWNGDTNWRSLDCQGRDLLNSTILDASLRPCFVTSTTCGFFGRRSTEIIDLSGTLVATILWKDKALEIGGTTVSIKFMKSKEPKHVFSLKRSYRDWQRYWQWCTSSPQYSIEYGRREWTATDCANYSNCAVFTSYKRRYFKKSQPATFTTEEALPEKEALFLLLAMLKMETRRIDLQEVGDLAFPLLVYQLEFTLAFPYQAQTANYAFGVKAGEGMRWNFTLDV